MSRPRLCIDLSTLAGNWRALSQSAAPARIAAVLKADSYGLGAQRIGPFLAGLGARHFFTAHHIEAAALRAVLPDRDIQIFSLQGLSEATVSEILTLGITPVLNSPDQVALWRRVSASIAGNPPAALNFDIGMNRLGLKKSDLDGQDLAGGLNLCLVMGHLSASDEPAHPLNAAQIHAFNEMCAWCPDVPKSLLNSAGLVVLNGPRFDLVRSGIALFGAMPGPGLGAVARLVAQIIALRDADQGESVGYGADYQVRQRARIATVSLGYADGYPRALGGTTARMWIEDAGVFAPVVGRISMDLVTLDVSAADPGKVGIGSWVEAFGPTVTVDEVATLAGTISYEILSRLAPRVERVYADI